MTDGLRETGRPPWLMWAVAVAETVTLTVLLVNLAAGDAPALARAIGPVHGALYLAGVLLTWTGRYPGWLKVLAVVPLVGAWFAARRGVVPVAERPPAEPPAVDG